MLESAPYIKGCCKEGGNNPFSMDIMDRIKAVGLHCCKQIWVKPWENFLTVRLEKHQNKMLKTLLRSCSMSLRADMCL